MVPGWEAEFSPRPDGRIDALDLAVLEDDLQFFPAHNAAPVFYAETLEQYPELERGFISAL